MDSITKLKKKAFEDDTIEITQGDAIVIQAWIDGLEAELLNAQGKRQKQPKGIIVPCT